MTERLRLILLRLVPGPVLRLVEGFWATPLAMALGGALMAGAVLAVPEGLLGPRLAGWLGSVDPAGARGVLGTVAGGMISLVALVFSLTFVALGLTAQTLSPRVSDFVLDAPSAQVLAGLALATFLFAAPVLSVGEADGAWRLGLAMGPALGLATATLVMTVMFAHAMTRLMRAEEIISRLGAGFVAGVRSISDPPAGCREAAADPAAFERALASAAPVAARAAGYVGPIDHAGLLTLAAEHDLRIRLDVGEGDYLLPGVPVAHVLGELPDEAAATIERRLNLTDRRTASGSAVYEGATLSEAALRALSPGINDPATAISCVNRLFEGLAVLAAGDAPSRLLAGEDGVARLLRVERGLPELAAATIHPVIAAARGDAQVLGRLVTLARQTDAVAIRVRDRAALAEIVARAKRAGRG